MLWRWWAKSFANAQYVIELYHISFRLNGRMNRWRLKVWSNGQYGYAVYVDAVCLNSVALFYANNTKGRTCVLPNYLHVLQHRVLAYHVSELVENILPMTNSAKHVVSLYRERKSLFLFQLSCWLLCFVVVVSCLAVLSCWRPIDNLQKLLNVFKSCHLLEQGMLFD